MLNAYKFHLKSLNFTLAYFNNRKQKTKIGSSFSDFLNIIWGIPDSCICISYANAICLWNMTQQNLIAT